MDLALALDIGERTFESPGKQATIVWQKFLNVLAKKNFFRLVKPQKLLYRHYLILKSKKYFSELLKHIDYDTI